MIPAKGFPLQHYVSIVYSQHNVGLSLWIVMVARINHNNPRAQSITLVILLIMSDAFTLSTLRVYSGDSGFSLRLTFTRVYLIYSGLVPPSIQQLW
jgi:hypothetical protein